ncbi:GNAT family N-acetyltransferase [Kribbella albertanoniae]|uniref:GNAT family N-acetyltransferase n=1 Tax=Kribbella albertanoniae TaxID=1266829 RepID=A0A4R4PZC0_9ACTN|nr:GNAT family N-acetyltransferase [Kribbella albertanoniae]TDC27819.1 GNAT family N-acetyltransferase [Kribbella albertanoniae]
MTFEIATAGTADVRRFSDWAADEQWNPGNSDPLAFAAADPTGFFVGQLDGEPIASVSGVRYGSDYGFLGLYIVRPSERGKGYGIRVWNRVMEHLAGRNVALDGVVEQQPNYHKSGFRHAHNHIRHEGVPTGSAPAQDVELVDGRSVPFDQLTTYDRRFFPAARDAFLALWVSLPGHRSLAAIRDGQVVGFAVLRPARSGARIGPVHAASDEIAAALITGLVEPGESVVIDVPDVNLPAMKLAERLGLAPVFECARMYTGGVPDVDQDGIFATTTLELG